MIIKNWICKLAICIILMIITCAQAQGANITVDGNINDWVGISPIVTDPQDSLFGDILDAYVTDNGSYLFFRVDLLDLSLLGAQYILNIDIDVNQDNITDYIISSNSSKALLLDASNLDLIDYCQIGVNNTVEIAVPLYEIGNPTSVNLVFSTSAFLNYPLDRAPDTGYVTYVVTTPQPPIPELPVMVLSALGVAIIALYRFLK